MAVKTVFGQPTHRIAGNQPTTTTFAYADMPIGKEVGNRELVVFAWGFPNGATALSTLELGGVSGTEIFADNSGSFLISVHRISGVAGGGVTGEQATLDMVFNGSMFDAEVMIMPCYGLGTLADSALDVAATAGALSLDVDTIANGAALGIAAYFGTLNLGLLCTWVGLSRISNNPYTDFSHTTAALEVSAAQAATPRTITVTSDDTDLFGALGVVLSFNPAENGLPSALLLGSNKRGGMQ